MVTKRYLVVFIVLISVFVTILIIYFNQEKHMSYEIIPSTLSQDQLWDLEYAEKFSQEAFSYGTGDMGDEAKFLVLVQQAWQGDKNAIIRYLMARENDRYVSQMVMKRETEFALFFRKYLYQIKDIKGNILEEPDFLKYQDSSTIIKQLAYLGHPEASVYWIFNSGHNVHYRPSIGYSFQKEEQKELVMLFANAIKGGYNLHIFWADILLWEAHSDNIYEPQKINSLINGILPDQQIQKKAVIEGYQVCALNGSFYCALHMAEAYLYGIGVEKNNLMAYAWAMTIEASYKPFLEKYIQEDKRYISYKQASFMIEIREHALKIANQIEEEMSDEQKIAAHKKLTELLELISYENDKWYETRNKVPMLMP